MSINIKPLVFIDTETTGLSPDKGALISIAAIFVGGKSDGESLVLKCKPHDGAIVNPFALQANGYTKEEISSWNCPRETAATFVYWITERLDNGELCHPAGWNYAFDDRFMRSWLSRNHSPTWYGNTFTDTPCDVMNLFTIQYPQFKSDERFGNKKLTTVYRGITGKDLANAHTEYADALATAHVFFHIAQESNSPALAPYLTSKVSPYNQ